jgi:hypothetical protein
LVIVADGDIQECKNRISNLQNILHQLTSTREQIEERRDTWCSLKSPIRRLPIEILREIFKDSVRGEKIEFGRINSESIAPLFRSTVVHRKVRMETPLRISRVCKLWRDISLTSGTLWSKLVLHMPYNMTSGLSKRNILALETLLARSGGHGLEFEIDAAIGPVDNDDPALVSARARYEAVVDYLLPYASRWVGAMFPITPAIANKLELQKADFSQLRRLGIANAGLLDPDLLMAFKSAVSLDWLSFVAPPRSTGVLPVAQLRELRVQLGGSHDELQMLQNILRACKVLRVLCVSQSGPLWGGIDLTPCLPMSYHHVTELVYSMTGPQTATFLDTLILPALENLVLDFGGFSPIPATTQASCNLAARSDWLVKSLTIKNTVLLSIDSTLLPILDSLPFLEELDVWDSYDPLIQPAPPPPGFTVPADAFDPYNRSTSLFQLLTIHSDTDGGASSVLPRLVRLSIHWKWSQEPDQLEDICRMVESRVVPNAVGMQQLEPCLSSVAFCLTSDIPQVAMDRLRALGHRDHDHLRPRPGLDVRVVVDPVLEEERQLSSNRQWGQSW